MIFNSFIPKNYQVNHLEKSLIVRDYKSTSSEALKLDVLFVGAGPASLTSAIHLARWSQKENRNLEIGVVEKADQIGGHSLSGAIVNPLVFKWLFPNKKEEELPFRVLVKKEAFYFLTKKKALPFPMPPGMKSKKYWTASLCEITRFLSKEAEALGVYLFPSYPAEKLIMENNKVIGALSKAYGLNKDGSQEGNFEASTEIFAKAVVLSEGSRGHLTQAYLKDQKIKSSYPQTYALGVKEIWEVEKDPDKIFHTIAWPLDSKTFGGSWFYPMGNNQVSLGLVAGLDSANAGLSVHDELQKMKRHPLFKKYLKGGKCIEWGAKTIPEGGYHALPERLSGDSVLIIGDSAGFVNMASLKGIHYAMASGYYAGESLIHAFEKENFSYKSLKIYDKKVKESFIGKDLYKYRNLRQSFHKGLFSGLIKAGLITLTRGWFPFDFKKSQLKTDSEAPRSFNPAMSSHFTTPVSNKTLSQQKQNQKNLTNLDQEKLNIQGQNNPNIDKPLIQNNSPSQDSSSGNCYDLSVETLNKQDAVYLSGNKTRDKIPSHLIKPKLVPKELGLFYEKMCPAAVYEQKEEDMIVNSPNCIDCKATDVLGPRWTPRERGSGPNYKIM